MVDSNVENIDKNILDKCSNLKILMSDVDGVLTDGGMYYSDKGEVMKKFHTRDGMGVELLLNQNIKTILISREDSEIVRQRAKKLKITEVFLGIKQKELLLEKICKKFDVSPNEIAYIGDDINDKNIMKEIGFSAAPQDAVSQIREIVDYVCKTKGGFGVLREISDIIIYSKNQ